MAFDPGRGRLWVVCRACRRWSLAPLEERWEALEELEKLVTKGPGGSRGGLIEPRLLAETENVSLFDAGPLEIVRVGGADLAEEAWWRYGRRLGEMPGIGEGEPLVQTRLPMVPKSLRGSGIVWRGRKSCPACHHPFTEIPFSDRNILIVRPGEGPPGAGGSSTGSAAPVISRRCPQCRDVEHGGLHQEGLEGELVLARLLAFEHHTGAPIDRVRAAARMVQDPDGPTTLVRIITRHGRPLGDIPPVGILALEMVTNAAREAMLLKMEMAELTFRWRQEEELAALVDGELTPLHQSVWERLARRVRGKD